MGAVYELLKDRLYRCRNCSGNNIWAKGHKSCYQIYCLTCEKSTGLRAVSSETAILELWNRNYGIKEETYRTRLGENLGARCNYCKGFFKPGEKIWQINMNEFHGRIWPLSEVCLTVSHYHNNCFQYAAQGKYFSAERKIAQSNIMCSNQQMRTQ